MADEGLREISEVIGAAHAPNASASWSACDRVETLARIGLACMTESDETVERLARAMCRASGVDPDGVAEGSSSLASGMSTMTVTIRMWERYTPAARTALASLREAGER